MKPPAADKSSESTSCKSLTPRHDRSLISQTSSELLTRFSSPQTLLAAFNPSAQTALCRDQELAFTGKAPSLVVVANAYGNNVAETWLEIQLEDLSEFAGCKEKLSPAKLSELAQMILESHGHYRLTEFMLFFQRFKRGAYGKFYGAVDPMVILQALSDFDEERADAHRHYETRHRREQKEAEDRAAREIHDRYLQRVPAGTENAALTFLQYRLLGYDTLSDADFAREIDDLCSGRKEIPSDVVSILSMVQNSVHTND